MKKRRLFLMAVLALCAAAASAGLVQPLPVTVDLDQRSALGDQVTARFADNDVEFIGCGIRAFDDGLGGIFSTGFCQAADANDVQFTCFTESPVLLEAIKATSAYAFISFGWNEDGECIRVGNSTQSFYIPAFKLKND